MTTIKHLRELLEKATPRYQNPAFYVKGGEHIGVIFHQKHAGLEVLRISGGNHVDVSLAIAALNSIPALLDVVEAAKTYRAGVIQRTEDESEWCAAGQMVSLSKLIGLAQGIDDALAKLDEVKP